MDGHGQHAEEAKKGIQSIAARTRGATQTPRSRDTEDTPIEDFVLQPTDVISGHGKWVRNHNAHYRDLINQKLESYANADTKLKKTYIVSEVVDAIWATHPRGRFVKQLNGTWYEISDSAAREKVGCSFRDMLDSKYKSSTRAKKRRFDEKVAKRRVGEERSRVLGVAGGAPYFVSDVQASVGFTGQSSRSSSGSSSPSLHLVQSSYASLSTNNSQFANHYIPSNTGVSDIPLNSANELYLQQSVTQNHTLPRNLVTTTLSSPAAGNPQLRTYNQTQLPTHELAYLGSWNDLTQAKEPPYEELKDKSGGDWRKRETHEHEQDLEPLPYDVNFSTELDYSLTNLMLPDHADQGTESKFRGREDETSSTDEYRYKPHSRN